MPFIESFYQNRLRNECATTNLASTYEKYVEELTFMINKVPIFLQKKTLIYKLLHISNKVHALKIIKLI